MGIVKLIKDIQQDNRGYGMAEMLMVASVVSMLCCLVISHIKPGLGQLHDNARETITSIAGGGKNK